MPRVVYTIEDAASAAISQISQPTVISQDGIEYTFIADTATIICKGSRDQIASLINSVDTQIQRPIVSVGDYGYIKTVMSPRSQIGADSPFTFNFIKQSALLSNDTARSVRVICGVYVDSTHAIVPLPAGAVVRSLIDGREMKIQQEGYAPEMVNADVVSYFKNVAGVALYNGTIAETFLRGVAFEICLKRQNQYMFCNIFNDHSNNYGYSDATVYTIPRAELPGVKIDNSDCKCKFKYGPIYACYRDDPNGQMNRYTFACTNCVIFYKNRIYAEVETGVTLQDAIGEYCAGLADTPAGAERAEIARDLIGGELISWNGKLCLRGKKWFYHPHLLWALSSGIALEFPGYHWV